MFRMVLNILAQYPLRPFPRIEPAAGNLINQCRLLTETFATTKKVKIKNKKKDNPCALFPGPSLLLASHPRLDHYQMNVPQLARVNAVVKFLIEAPHLTKADKAGKSRSKTYNVSMKPVPVVSAGVRRHQVDEATKELFSYDGVPCRKLDLGKEVTIDGNLQGGILDKWDVRFKDDDGTMHRGCLVKRRHSDELLHCVRHLPAPLIGNVVECTAPSCTANRECG